MESLSPRREDTEHWATGHCARHPTHCELGVFCSTHRHAGRTGSITGCKRDVHCRTGAGPEAQVMPKRVPPVLSGPGPPICLLSPPPPSLVGDSLRRFTEKEKLQLHSA